MSEIIKEQSFINALLEEYGIKTRHTTPSERDDETYLDTRTSFCCYELLALMSGGAGPSVTGKKKRKLVFKNRDDALFGACE